jgi:anti-sigma regulatory factor (Ser/Thr protein kinase)
VVELLRAATSEVKDYRRISLGHAPGASVRASAATDVVHIVAELLENATRFSPPDRKVVLAADRGTDGGLLFEVIDAGLGMAPDDLEQANHRLDAADAVGPETTRRMGLFVVSLLAARHGVTVRLRPTYDRVKQAGITASVHVPGALVLSDGSPATARIEAAPEPAALAPAVEPAEPLVPVTTGGPPTVPPLLPIPPSNGSAIGWFTPFVAVEEPASTDTTRPVPVGSEHSGWLTPATPPAKPPATPAAPVEKSFVTQRAAPGEVSGATKNGSGATKSVPDTEPPTIRTTAAGLPMRRPGSKPLPAKPTGKPAAEKAGTGFRDPDAIRNNLSRHYSGVQAARRTREGEEPDSESGPGHEN